MTSARGSASRLIVIGAGIAGLSAAWSASMMGFSVTCLESREIGHAAGSSAGTAKIFRYAYEDVRYARFLAEVEPLWRKLESRMGAFLIGPCPGLNIGLADSLPIASVIDTLEAVDRKYEVLERRDPRLPAFGIRLHEGELAVLEPGAGVLNPADVLTALERQLIDLGATIHERTTATRVETYSGGVRVDTESGALTADRVIIAAGPWLPDLVKNPPKPLTVTRQHQLTLATSGPVGGGARFAWADLARDDVYGIANHDGVHLIGNHAPGPVGRNSTDSPDEKDLSIVRSCLAELEVRLIGEPELKVIGSRVCHYTNTNDGSFLITHHKEVPGVIVLSACSGHGFKFALGTGRQAAELAFT